MIGVGDAVRVRGDLRSGRGRVVAVHGTTVRVQWATGDPRWYQRRDLTPATAMPQRPQYWRLVREFA